MGFVLDTPGCTQKRSEMHIFLLDGPPLAKRTLTETLGLSDLSSLQATAGGVANIGRIVASQLAILNSPAQRRPHFILGSEPQRERFPAAGVIRIRLWELHGAEVNVGCKVDSLNPVSIPGVSMENLKA